MHPENADLLHCLFAAMSNLFERYRYVRLSPSLYVYMGVCRASRILSTQITFPSPSPWLSVNSVLQTTSQGWFCAPG